MGLLLRPPRRAAGADRMAELTDPIPVDLSSALLHAGRAGDLLRAEREGRLLRRSAAGGSCSCGCAGADALRETVRERYAAAALATTDPTAARAAAAPTPRSSPTSRPSSSAAASTASERDELPEEALIASLGCGNPTAMADLQPGQVVLDLGSGGGIDVLLSARRVAPTGTAYGLDMTDEMLELARANQAKAGVDERPLAQGPHRSHPAPGRAPSTSSSPTASSTSPPTSRQVLREAARVLKPGGRFAVSDVIADPDMDDATRADLAAVRRLHRRRAHPRRVHALPRRRRPHRHRDHRDPPRPRARRLGHHPRPQARVDRRWRQRGRFDATTLAIGEPQPVARS